MEERRSTWGYELGDAADLMENSPSGRVTGQYVFCKLGMPADFPAAVSGKIALIERGELSFADKAKNAKAAGAIGVIVFNNLPGSFGGNDVWKHQITLYLRSRETFDGDPPTAYYRLFRLITKGVPASSGVPMLNQTVHPSCYSMDVPSIAAKLLQPTNTVTSEDHWARTSDERLDEWLSFSDAGRAFILLVALGDSASEETRTELLTILNSLNFEGGS